MTSLEPIAIAANWTTAAGALESVLGYLGTPLPRHAVMGLSGHAWHLCLGTREGVTALPSGPADILPEWRLAGFARTGFTWECFGAALGDDPAAVRDEAVAWAERHLAEGRPLIGWDFHLHEHAVVYGYDAAREGFLISDILTPDLGPFVARDDWPSTVGRIELYAPAAPAEADPVDAITGSLAAALEAFAGRDGASDGQPRGTAALRAWADALDGDIEVDRAGNAYTLAVLAAARTDGAAFLSDLADSIPEASEALRAAAGALGAETKALSPLLTLFPFPSGGHGNVANPGLRRAAAMALRRAAEHEDVAARHIGEALALFDPGVE